ncbi:MAG: ABC transporter permease subunit [Parachlamydiales bacterium]
MLNYLIRRLLLIPITLLAILFVNFVLISLAPGDPSTQSNMALMESGAADASTSAGSRDDQYLLFRQHYGLTLPILFNSWPNRSEEEVAADLHRLVTREGVSAKEYQSLRIRFGDQAPYQMGTLLKLAEEPQLRERAIQTFARGGTRPGYVGASLTGEQRAYNQKVIADNQLLSLFRQRQDLEGMKRWYADNRGLLRLEPSRWERVKIFFLETRLVRYFKRVLTFDFGTLRNDPNRRVISEVAKRLKVSVALSAAPMLITFCLAQVLGFIMAVWRGRFPDLALNLLLLLLYALPIFVVAPFLIEKVGLTRGLPISGLTSPPGDFAALTSAGRLKDLSLHLILPFIAVTYGSCAAQSRLARTAVLEVLKQDFIRTARAKGLSTWKILTKHVGRCAAITMVTSLASSLGVLLSGTLIIEALFSIDGFGHFFYDAILGRDYNVILFSGLVSSVIALAGYLLADIAYTVLDPRVALDA